MCVLVEQLLPNSIQFPLSCITYITIMLDVDAQWLWCIALLWADYWLNNYNYWQDREPLVAESLASRAPELSIFVARLSLKVGGVLVTGLIALARAAVFSSCCIGVL